MECFGRDREATEIWRRFDAGENLLMLAPRRIGKTFLLDHLRETAADRGYRAVVLDVEGYHEEKDFLRQCCAVIQEELSTGATVMKTFTHRLSRILRGSGGDGLDWRQWLLRTDWPEFADQLFAHLNESEPESPWLILVDELPVFIQGLHGKDGTQGVRQFLYWLRRMRQKHRNIRRLYAGSIGLDTVARRHRVEGALNDLGLFDLEPFDTATATAFLEDVAGRRGCTFDRQALDRVVDRLGWLSPYYLKHIAEDACIGVTDKNTINSDLVDAAMDRLLEPGKRLYWAGWREHLDRNFTEPDRGRLYVILESIARGDNGVSRDGLLPGLNRGGEPVNEGALRDLIDTLLADGYLIEGEGNRYRFRMNLLREWWLRYVVL